jgi:hypothetical protein
MPSRAEIFRTTPNEALPAPTELRLAFFMSAAKPDTAAVVDDGIRLNDAFYEPIREDEDARDCMNKAAAIYKLYKIKVPIIRLYLKGKETFFVKFAGHDIEPIRKKKARSFRGKKHPKDQKDDIQRISSRLPEKLERMEQVIIDTFGAELGQDAYFKTAVPLHNAQPGVPESAPTQAKAGTSSPLVQQYQEGPANSDDSPPADTSPRKKPVATEGLKADDTASDEAQPQRPTLPHAVQRLRENFFKDDEEAL